MASPGQQISPPVFNAKASERLQGFLLMLGIAANFSGLFLTIIGPDGTLYASVAKTMAQNNNFIELFGNGTDWLDKPHFPFWVTALSFKIFGINNWSYKLPAILFLLAGVAYTRAFALSLYQNRTIANWSALILLSAEHIILSNTDVRAEPYLTALVIAAIYHYHRAWTENKIIQLLLGSVFTACAIMTKGIFAFVPITAAVAGQLLFTGHMKDFFHWRWVAALFLVFLFITPELYALYYQFDLHPEKIVFGKSGVSGLRFFFWDSQFGRFFNTGPIKGKGDPSFFFHTLLWAFLPWSLLLYPAVFRLLKKAFRKEPLTEWYSITGSMVTFTMFSMSRFQLPHYMNIIFPLFAIITAQYIFYARNIKVIRTTQYIIVILLAAAVAALHLFFKPDVPNTPVWILLAFVLASIIFLPYLFRVPEKDIIIGRSLLAIVFVSFYINGFFYPRLLTYQGGTNAALFANENYADVRVVQLRARYNYPIEFYLDAPLVSIEHISDTAILKKPYLLFISGEDSALTKIPVSSFNNFPVSKLNAKFINPKTRAQQVKPFFLYLFR